MKIKSYENNDLIQESPQKIAPTSFGLENRRINRITANKFLTSSKSKIIETVDDDVALYQIGQKYALIHKQQQSVLYYVQYEIIQHGLIPFPCIAQIKLWRTSIPNQWTVQFRTEHVFFDILLQKTGCLITDTQHTDDGERFWLLRVKDAFNRKLNVYYISFIEPRKLEQIQNWQSFTQLISNDEIWGWNHKYLIISNKKL